jgi:hypothetical protein
MPSARENQQAVKLIDQGFRLSLLQPQIIALISNLPDYVAFIETFDDFIATPRKVETMDDSFVTFRERRGPQLRIVQLQWAQLEIFQVVLRDIRIDSGQQTAKMTGIIDQGLTMIGEWQRYHASACDQTRDSAEWDTADHFLILTNYGIRHSLVTVSPAQSFQPRGCMKDAGLRMSLHEALPPRISYRIYSRYLHRPQAAELLIPLSSL